MTAPRQAAPYQDTVTGQQPPAHGPTPDQDGLIAAVAALLLLGAGAALTAAAIRRLLLARRMPAPPLQVLTVALKLAGARTAHQPRMVGRSDVARIQQRIEAAFRAAYALNAADRIQRAVNDDVQRGEVAAWSRGEGFDARAAGDAAMRDAVRRERRFEALHEQARRGRMAAAVEVAEAADVYGPLLGWWTVRDSHVTPECLAAHGSNFRADAPPAIGWPGTLHGATCRCKPGPPHPGGPSTDQATGYA